MRIESMNCFCISHMNECVFDFAFCSKYISNLDAKSVICINENKVYRKREKNNMKDDRENEITYICG